MVARFLIPTRGSGRCGKQANEYLTAKQTNLSMRLAMKTSRNNVCSQFVPLPSAGLLVPVALSLLISVAFTAKEEDAVGRSKSKGRLMNSTGQKISFNPSDFDFLEGKVYRGNLGRTGVHKTTGASGLANVKWKFSTGGPVRSSPVVVAGVIYIGSGDGCIYAIRAADGKELWKHHTGGFVSGSAAVVGDRVFIANEAGRLFALEAKTGKVLWTADTGGNTAGSPAVAYGAVFISNGSKGGHRFFGMSGGRLLAFRAADGSLIWESPDGTNNVSSVATDGRLLYGSAASSGCGCGIHDLATGAIVLDDKTGDQARVYNSHTVANGHWYAPVNIRGVVRCYQDKKLVWEVATNPHNLKFEMQYGGKFGYEINCDLAVTEKLVLAGCMDGNLYAFSADKGEEKWTFKTGGAVQGSPSAAQDTIYFGSGDGFLYAVSMNGRLKSKIKLGDMINSSPWPDDGMIYVGCDDGYLYAIE
jgi:eukaryotic-like serine/threonine-protein kinase